MNDRDRIYCCVAIVAAFAGQAARAETTVGADVSVEGGYASNPFLGATGTTEAALARAIFMPNLSIASATSDLSLSGRVAHTEFSRRYDGFTDYSADAQFRKSLSALSSFDLKAGYARRTSNALIQLDPSPDDPDQDPTDLENTGRKVETINGEAAFSTALSPRGSLNIQTFASRVHTFGGSLNNGQNYKRYGGAVGYSHALSELFSLGASVSVSRNDYEVATLGHSTLISPSVNAQVKITPRVRLSASGGAAFSDIQQSGFTINQTSFFGSAELCRDGDRSSICVRAGRSIRPTLNTGLSKVTTLGLSASYQLSPRSSVRARLNYQRTNSLNAGLPNEVGNRSANAQYSRDLSRRLSFVAEANYTDPYRSSIVRNSNFTAKVGVTYRLGRTQ